MRADVSKPHFGVSEPSPTLTPARASAGCGRRRPLAPKPQFMEFAGHQMTDMPDSRTTSASSSRITFMCV